jgi:hypothetical protein
MARSPSTTRRTSKTLGRKRTGRPRKGQAASSGKKASIKKSAAKKASRKPAATKKMSKITIKHAGAKGAVRQLAVRSGTKRAAAVSRTPSAASAKAPATRRHRQLTIAARPPARTSARRRTGPSVLSFAPGLENFVSASSSLNQATEALASRVAVTIAPTTISNEPIQAQRGRLRERSLDDFRSRRDACRRCRDRTAQAVRMEEGKIVLFAAGNGHQAWPRSMPEVLSIGGVYVNAAGEFRGEQLGEWLREQSLSAASSAGRIWPLRPEHAASIS